VSRDWDAATYDRVSGPQVGWAGPVVDRLALRGDETVLDAGCGSGRVTLMLLERLPRGRVLAVDGSESMVRHAREALGRRATVLHADLLELELDEPVDVVFSNAVFHWVPDHDLLFRRLHRALRPGGRLVAQCGGDGNLERFLRAAAEVAAEEPFARHLAGWHEPLNFAAPRETAKRLEAAGFAGVDTWLEPRPVTPDDPESFIRTVCLAPHVDRLPEDLRGGYLAAVCRVAPAELDYVRLNIVARRPR
jgi:trans-aconitate 2-methyltransferase